LKDSFTEEVMLLLTDIFVLAKVSAEILTEA
jgi:hypothetical protein